MKSLSENRLKHSNTGITFKSSTAGFVGTIILTALCAWIIWLSNERYFFQDDTQNGAYGIWYEIGQSVLQKKWLTFSSSAWMAGNYAAEGQWGIWSPMFMAIGVFCVKLNDAFLCTALVKGFFMCLASSGIYLVAKSYKANNLWAMFAGVACSISGFTLFRDIPSWVTNHMIWALLPWVWWATRRLMYQNKSPLVPFIFGYSLVTIGYVHGVIMLIVMYLSLLVEALVVFKVKPFWKNTAIWKMVLNGALIGLVSLCVFLPGVLTGFVGSRAADIGNSGFMVSNLSSIFTAGSPSQMPEVPTWNALHSLYSPMPYTYIAWFLPLVFFIDFASVKNYLKELVALIIFTVFSFLFTIGPSDLGALRYPVRLLPFVCFGVLTLFAILISRSQAEVTLKRIIGASLFSLFGWYVAWGQTPEEFAFHNSLDAFVLLGIVLAALSLKKWSFISEKINWLPLCIVLTIFTGVVLNSQLTYFGPRAAKTYANFDAPRHFEDYQKLLPDSKGNVIVIGQPWLIPDLYKETAISNNWYITEKDTHNRYSIVVYKAYSEDLGIGSLGMADYSTKDKLFNEVDSVTNQKLVDLLSIDTVQILKENGKYKTQDEFIQKNTPPAGWHMATVSDNSLVWVRDNPMGPAGGVAWTSPGFKVEQLAHDEKSVTFKVLEVPQGGGNIVFSRLNWPGYQVDSGALDGTVQTPEKSVRYYLLTAGISDKTVGKTITISFTPPMWRLEVLAMKLAILGIVLWTLLHYGYFLFKRKKDGNLGK